jgi:hypothetical protein
MTFQFLQKFSHRVTVASTRMPEAVTGLDVLTGSLRQQILSLAALAALPPVNAQPRHAAYEPRSHGFDPASRTS